jgi:hypothetical protein
MRGLNNVLADQFFLRSCFNEDPTALRRWEIDSYQKQICMAFKKAADKMAPGQLEPGEIKALFIHCTSAIYEQHETFPDNICSLKTQVGKYAYAYMIKYLGSKWSAGNWRR